MVSSETSAFELIIADTEIKPTSVPKSNLNPIVNLVVNNTDTKSASVPIKNVNSVANNTETEPASPASGPKSNVNLVVNNTETKPASIPKNNVNSAKESSSNSEAVASESKNSPYYRFLRAQHRHAPQLNTSNPDASQNGQDFRNDAPLTRRIISATIKNPLNAEEVYRYSYPEFEATDVTPIVGFAVQSTPENIEYPTSRSNEPKEPWKVFPPPANSAYAEMGRKSEQKPDSYALDSYGISPQVAAFAIENTPLPQGAVLVEPIPPRESKGKMVATRMNFRQKAWVQFEPPTVGEIYSGEEQKADFIKNLDDGAETEYCKKCGRRHIIPGNPLTLPERDPCGAYLPEWFPSDGIHKPWLNFIEMINHLVLLCEIEQGYSHRENPERALWNLEFHDNHEKWKQIGRSGGKGGWWKCRNGPEATIAERSCRGCTSTIARERDNEASDRANNGTTVAQHKSNIENWIMERIKEIGRQDKEAALAMWRANGIPLHYGLLPSRIGIYPVTEGGRPITAEKSVDSEPHCYMTHEQMFSGNVVKGNGQPSKALKPVTDSGTRSRGISHTSARASPVVRNPELLAAPVRA